MRLSSFNRDAHLLDIVDAVILRNNPRCAAVIVVHYRVVPAPAITFVRVIMILPHSRMLPVVRKITDREALEILMQ